MAPLNSRFSAAAPLNSSLWAGNRYPSQRQYNTTDEEVAAVFGYDRRDRTQATAYSYRGTKLDFHIAMSFEVPFKNPKLIFSDYLLLTHQS